MMLRFILPTLHKAQYLRHIRRICEFVLKTHVSKFRGEGEARCVYPPVVRVCQHRSEAESARACIYDIIVIPLEVLAVVLEQQFDVPAIV